VPERLDQAAFEREFPGMSGSAAELLVNVVRTGEAFMAVLQRVLQEYGLSAAGRQVLAVVEGAGGPLPASTVAERMLVTTATMTSVLDTLEKRGLVVRLPDPTDRRRVLVGITDEAKAVVDAQLPKVAAVQAALAEPLSERDRETVIRAMHILRAQIAEVDAAAVAAKAPKRRKPKR
jgi:DNA-binding MarR family transcriptional regulator